MRYFFMLLVFITYNFTITAQTKRDYHWLMGGADWEADIPGIQAFGFDFNKKPFEVQESNIGYTFDHNNTSISDLEGNLLFYSNGCAVMNANHEVMLNGEDINDGAFFNDYWGGDCYHGYPGTQNIITLTDPAYEDGYYIIHKTTEYSSTNGPSESTSIKYSYIDMSLNDQKGKVIEKNILFTSGNEPLLSSYLSAISHVNGIDWWILQPERNTNQFILYLLNEEGFHEQNKQEIGYEVNGDWTSASGTACFSPDGTKYAMYNFYYQLHVYDFDRSTGLLSNHQSIEIYPPYQEELRFCGVEWSPNSRFIYTASQTELHQMDTWEEDIQTDGIALIDTFNGTSDPLENTFRLMAQGPDCRIYITAGSNTTYHVINKPDEIGLDCNFDQNGILLPYHSGRASFPNNPRWRVDEEEKCDPTIVSVFGIPVYTRKNLEVYPNPTRDIVNVKIPENKKGEIEIRNNKGLLVYSEQVSNQTMEIQLSLGRYSSGLYYIEFVPDKNTEKMIYTGKVELIK